MGTGPVSPQRRPPPPPSPGRTPPSAPPARTGAELWTPPKTNALAVASLALSLFWLAGLGSIGAVVLGHMAKREIARSQGRQTGENLAMAGLVIGYIGVAIMALYVIFYIVALTSA